MKALTSGLLVLVVGCATNDSPVDESKPRQLMPNASNPTFTLYVSNQSLDNTVVDMHVYIDGQLAVAGDFSVFQKHEDGAKCGGAPLPQHNWYEFNFDLAPGPHTITVASDDVAATLSTHVTIGPRMFGVLDYWYDAAQTPEAFQFDSMTEQPGFD